MFPILYSILGIFLSFGGVFLLGYYSQKRKDAAKLAAWNARWRETEEALDRIDSKIGLVHKSITLRGPQ